MWTLKILSISSFFLLIGKQLTFQVVSNPFQNLWICLWISLKRLYKWFPLLVLNFSKSSTDVAYILEGLVLGPYKGIGYMSPPGPWRTCQNAGPVRVKLCLNKKWTLDNRVISFYHFVVVVYVLFIFLLCCSWRPTCVWVWDVYSKVSIKRPVLWNDLVWSFPKSLY